MPDLLTVLCRAGRISPAEVASPVHRAIEGEVAIPASRLDGRPTCLQGYAGREVIKVERDEPGFYQVVIRHAGLLVGTTASQGPPRRGCPAELRGGSWFPPRRAQLSIAMRVCAAATVPGMSNDRWIEVHPFDPPLASNS